jgi:oligoendopeptidase F
MTTIEQDPTAADLAASNVGWRLNDLIAGTTAEQLVTEAEQLAEALQRFRGRVAVLDAAELAELMGELSDLSDRLGRAGTYVGLKFAENTADAAVAADMQRITERSTTLSATLLFIDLEWAATDDAHAAHVLGDDRLGSVRHHLENLRRSKPHQLAEPQEVVLSESSVVGASAWVRLFEEQTSAIEVTLPSHGQEPVSLMQGLGLLQSPDRATRAEAASAVTDALAPGLRTRAYIYNTLLLNRSVSDRLRSFPSWIS